ncbi:hypothetical protein VZ94_01365 [Methylocucumis oryzae]|uniref:Uncharacterized protein n=1 Tax=Methylocucumis oryzae TaxID=1632867 RepID=A0A0F3IN06_9GAMM|nr:hypothetical protein VZ94_01365 [Methylocucumis oryzae]
MQKFATYFAVHDAMPLPVILILLFNSDSYLKIIMAYNLINSITLLTSYPSINTLFYKSSNHSQRFYN